MKTDGVHIVHSLFGHTRMRKGVVAHDLDELIE